MTALETSVQRTQIEFLAKNDFGNHTTRYKWELLYSETLAKILIVERYGFKGDTCWSWVVNSTSDAVELLSKRFSKLTLKYADQSPRFELHDSKHLEHGEKVSIEVLKATIDSWAAGMVDHKDKMDNFKRTIYRFFNSGRPKVATHWTSFFRSAIYGYIAAVNAKYPDIPAGINRLEDFGSKGIDQPKVVEEPVARPSAWGVW